MITRYEKRGKVTYLGEESCDDGSVSELAASKFLQSLLARLCGVVLDEDLAHAGRLPTAAAGSRNLQRNDVSKLAALVPDIFADF